MRWSIFLLPFFTAACVEYGLEGNKKNNNGNDSDDTDDTDDTADTFPDDCEVEIAEAFDVNIKEECEGYDPEEVEDAWDLGVEWQTGDGYGSVMMPAVGNLTDDNDDGSIDDADTPDIAYVGYGGASVLYVHSGDGTGTVWTANGFRTDAGVTIADIDGDGVNDVVGITPDGHVLALNNDGTVKWTSAAAFAMLWPVTTAADLDGDGTAEVIADMGLVNGEDGSTIASLTNDGATWRSPIAADIDADGNQEILLAQHVYDSEGTPLWTATDGFGTSCFGAIYQGDEDEQAEIALNWGPNLFLYEHDGTLITQTPTPGAAYNPGPPCVGDIDGDGEAEIIAPSGSQITAYSTEGDIEWSSAMVDYSGAAGCSVYDMNGDGTYEVLFADENDLRIYDGTGTVLYSNPTHQSVTYFEYPVVADVDVDGSAEIVAASSANSIGITVFGHNGSGWPAAGPSWGIHDYAFTNQNTDGTLPAHPIPSWMEYNIFRGRPSADQAGLPDLYVEITDVCATGCGEDDTILVAYQVSNLGGTDVTVATSLAVYADGVLIKAQNVPPVPSGEALEGDVLELSPADIAGAQTLAVVIDDDGTSGMVTECDEENNGFEVDNDVCP